MRIFLCLFLSFLCVSCGSMFVDYDYDKKATFSDYKTYQYDFSEASGLSEFDERRFVKYTDSILATQGFERTDYNDLFVKITASEYEQNSRNTLGVGVGGGGGNVGVSLGGGVPIGGPELHQRIVVTLYEAREGQETIWEATSESDVKLRATPDQRDAYFKKLVSKIFKNYPPKE